MLRLILMRHTKSSWDSPTLSDHDRPLNKRGQRSAKALGSWLREKKIIPKEALISDSVRTQQTFSGLNLDITRELKPELKPDLYHSSSDVLLQTIENAKEDVLLIVAHNPGIGELALRFARMMRHLPSHSRFVDFPTGATLVVQWDAYSWQDINWSQGKIIEFIVPRDLL